MANPNQPVQRRNVYERKALCLLRGEPVAFDARGPAIRTHARRRPPLDDYCKVHFACLREFARRNGLEVEAVGSKYVSTGELTVLRWLAEAQRRSGLRTCDLGDLGLKTSLLHCAELLKDLGMPLPVQTLYSYPSGGHRTDSIGMPVRRTPGSS
ncbi:hypothetical protein [Phenylobacterium sp.]|uniref:hypothetical protein n=1 Tax=Phenylobacterium sp. TaxID=1871053 RepID=UPI00301BCBD8